jgi:hypothetical protein
MNSTNFITNFADLFDETDASTITAQTHFRDLDEWSQNSLMLVITINACIKLRGISNR